MQAKRARRTKNPWRTLKTELAYDNPWISVTHHDVSKPSGAPGIYGVVHFKNVAVGILAIDERARILLVGQWRYPLKRYSWEVPAGGCPKGRSPLATARKELREETGYTAKSWKKVLQMDLSNSVTDERAVIFVARDLRPGQAEPEDTESLRTKWVTLEAALRMIDRGTLTDAITVAAVLRLAREPHP